MNRMSDKDTIYRQDVFRIIDRKTVRGKLQVAREVLKLPSADVLPVVLCKDCVYWSSKETRYCNMLKGTFQENDYCSYGERKGIDNVSDE